MAANSKFDLMEFTFPIRKKDLIEIAEQKLNCHTQPMWSLLSVHRASGVTS